ncbi:hypothetical protein BS78_03G067000 [Paspalum vaginatum]|nr:hypothetical protein BS78_03G067000 [Paspalum vaginatum]
MATPNGLARIEAHGEKKDENGVCHEDDSALPVRAQTIDELHSLQRKRSAPTSAALSDDSEEKHHRQQMQSISTTAAAQRTGSSPPVDVVMAMRKRNHGNDNWRNNTAAGAVVGAGARQLLRQALEDAPPTVLLGVGFVTSVAAVRAAASLAYPAYLGSLAVAGALFGGLGTMWAAGWVAADPALRVLGAHGCRRRPQRRLQNLLRYASRCRSIRVQLRTRSGPELTQIGSNKLREAGKSLVFCCCYVTCRQLFSFP